MSKSSGGNGNIRAAVREVVAASLDELRNQTTAIIAQYMRSGEKLHGYQRGEQQMHFLLRILPIMPDVVSAPKLFVLAITSERVLIVRLKKALLTRKSNGSVLAEAIPLSEIESATPKVGMLTSSIVLRTTAGKSLKYTNMLKSAADSLVRSLDAVRQK